MISNKPCTPSVLIVDDEEFIRWALEEYLKQCNFCNIIKASDGTECVEQVLSNGEDIALVIMDIHMPRMDGFEALEALRKEFDGIIGVVLMTGYYSDSMLDQARSEEDDKIMVLDFFQKPFDMQELRDAVARGVDTVMERRTQAIC